MARNHGQGTVRDDARVLVVGRDEWVGAVEAALDGWEILVETALDDALDRIAGSAAIDCVVVGYDLPDGDGLQLVERIRAARPDLSVVVYTDRGDESVASAATTAGATAYVVASEDGGPARLRESVSSAVDEGSTVETGPREHRLLDVLLSDPDSFVWILDSDGRVTRSNPAALERCEAAERTVRGETLWSLSVWDGDERARVRDAVDRGLEGRAVDIETTIRGRDRDPIDVELSVQPVTDARDRVEGLLVEGTDVSEREQLARELRRSEELHRVTLNNMTDTVLVTDDRGAFTYVCPNVHFIFGYSAAEIHEFGTIDALLGEDVLDREALAERGVLTNVECTATDKAGREHTLLVNVREVSIQEGTILFSCRDVTTRKRREEALTALHDVAPELLYAETRAEIANIVADEATRVLDVPATAVYLFDADANRLRPTARSDGMDSLAGPLDPLEPGGTSLVGRTFVADEPAFVTDPSEAEAWEGWAGDLQCGLFVPLADHGVFVAGAGRRDILDEVGREVADLLATTAEAALDRVERETELRRQENALQRRNRQLVRAKRINDLIRGIDRAVVGAETREEIEHAVCERLTTVDRFAFAWIGAYDAVREELEPSVWAGAERDYVDAVDVTDLDAAEPAAVAAADRESVAVDNVAGDLSAAPWRREAIAREFTSVVAVPLVYEDVLYGTLAVYADQPEAFDETVQAVLGELARTIASAIGSLERRDALASDDLVELEYELTDSECTLLRLARESGGSLSLEGGFQRTADGVRAFVSVDEASAETVVAAAERSVAVEAARTIVDGSEGGVLRLRLSRPFLATTLADHGGVLRTYRATPDAARITVEVPRSLDVRPIDEVISSAHSDARLVGRRRRQRAPADELWHHDVLDRLTDRQLEVVQTAYHSGFFESPRRLTGEEVADVLDISPGAFYSHARTVQRKVFETLFEERLARAQG